jgi:DNA-directed RNA polymerase subunit K/omega
VARALQLAEGIPDLFVDVVDKQPRPAKIRPENA